MFEEPTYTLKDFVQNVEEHTERIKRDRTPEVLTINGSPELVVQDAESYRHLVARVEQVEFLNSLQAALRQADEGQAQPAESVFKDISAKHGF